MARIDTILVRRDTAANWASVNPVLGLGEGGYEKDTRLKKTGDGSTAWNDLAYQAVVSAPKLTTARNIASTGNVTWSVSFDGSGNATGAATIQLGVVTNTMLSSVPTSTFKGRSTAGTGSPEDLTATQATALLNPFTSALKGLVPASGGGTTTYLRADGTFAAPPSGAGTVTNVSATGANGITVSVTNPSTAPAIAIGGANLTPTTITGGAWTAATKLQTACRVTFDDGVGNFELMANGLYDTSDTRLRTGFAGRMEFNASVGNWLLQTAVSGAANSAITYVNRLVVENGGAIRPGADNSQSIGSASFRFTQLFAASGTINTSDRDAKKYIGDIPDAWLDAWSNVKWRRFKMRGGGERWHVGLVAQDVHTVFADKGLDAFELGLCCYDEWGDQYEIGADGDTRLVMKAGSRWGLRYDECQSMEAAFVRRALTRAGIL